MLGVLILGALMGCAYAEDGEDPPGSPGKAAARLLERIEGNAPSFLETEGFFLVRADVNGNAEAPLAALLERALLEALRTRGRFRMVGTPSEIGLIAPRLDDATLDRFDRAGADRLLDVSVTVKGDRLLVRARALWLEGRSWAGLLRQPLPFREERFRVWIGESAWWRLLARADFKMGAESPRLPWRTEKVLESAGRVLALALGDLDGDRRDDLALLFADRVEFWMAEDGGYRFRKMKSLDAFSVRPVRWSAGFVRICERDDDRPSRLLFGTNAMADGGVLVWNGETLAEVGRLDGIPLSCEDGAPVASFRPGSASLERKQALETAADRLKPPLPAGDLLWAFPSERGWITLDTDGRVRIAGAPELSGVSCGSNPFVVADGDRYRMACSLPLAVPDMDGLQVFTLDSDGRVLESVRHDRKPGAIYAVTGSLRQGEETWFAARYDERLGRTIIDRYRR